MKGTVIYTEEPEDVRKALEHAVPISDFLPPPSQLVKRQKKERVNIMLDKSTVDFFKHQSSEHGTPYQTMINEVLNRYVAYYTN